MPFLGQPLQSNAKMIMESVDAVGGNSKSNAPGRLVKKRAQRRPGLLQRLYHSGSQ